MTEVTFELQNFADYDAIAVTQQGPYPMSAPTAWTALWTWIGEHDKIDNVRRKVGFGMDDPRVTLPLNLRYRACAVLHAMPEQLSDPIEQFTLAGGAYAVHRMKGPYLAMPATFAIFRTAVEETHEIDPHRPFQEIYLNDPSTLPPTEWLTDLCIPLKG